MNTVWMRGVFRIYFWAFLSLFDSCVVKNSQDRGEEVAGETHGLQARLTLRHCCISMWNLTLRLAQMKEDLPRGVLLNCFILALCNSPQRALTLVCIQKVFACHLFHILPLQPYSTSQSYTQHPIMIKCKRLLGGWVNPEFFWVWEGLCYLLVNSVLYFSAFEFSYYSDPWYRFLILSFVYFILVSYWWFNSTSLSFLAVFLVSSLCRSSLHGCLSASSSWTLNNVQSGTVR